MKVCLLFLSMCANKLVFTRNRIEPHSLSSPHRMFQKLLALPAISGIFSESASSGLDGRDLQKFTTQIFINEC